MGEGFGAATLRAAPYFRMRPRTVDGAPVDGGRVIIPLRWQVAGGPPGPHSCGAARPVTPVALPPPMPLPTPAAEATPQAVAGPNWVRTPTGDDLSRIYPGRARDRRLGGHTTMACKVRKDGTLTDCAITEETPTGYGFGEAALASAQYFRMSPTTADGKSVEGGTVVIPIGWRMAP
jgi:protein TonB